MGKNKKKDAAKKFALQAQKQAKADKKAQKRLNKENRKAAEAEKGSSSSEAHGASAAAAAPVEDDIDAILESYKQQTIDLATPTVQILTAADDDNENTDIANSSPFPYPPRGNFTLTSCPTTGEIVMFGGEYFNGVENVVFDELYIWNPDAKNTSADKDNEDSSDDDYNTGKKSHNEKKSNTSAEKNKNNKQIGVWKRVLSPSPRPPARCSHSTVFYNNALYVFGGELATPSNYHHYRDLWKFDLKTLLWTELKPRSSSSKSAGPTPRSGHRALVWRHYMILFGGFFEAAREAPRWYNDLFVYDFGTNTWLECAYSKLATIPAERSAFNFGLCTGGGGGGGGNESSDVAYLYGGYSKLKNPAPGTKAEGRTHTDCWALYLRGLEQNKTPRWERISRKGEYPSMRSGTSCITWKNKMLVHGGVDDEEGDHHKIQSVFYDDLFAFDMERRRWFSLKLKKKAGSGRRRKKKDTGEEEAVAATSPKQGQNDEDSEDEDEEGIEGEAVSSGWDLDKLRSNMFAFIDGDGNIVYEKIEQEGEEGKEGETPTESSPKDDQVQDKDEEAEDSGYVADDTEGDVGEKKKGEIEISGKNIEKDLEDKVQKMQLQPNPLPPLPIIQSSEVMVVNESGAPEAVGRQTPLPRISAEIVVRGNTLYLYGGILEVGNREITLDDCWSIDLQKREKWVCIWEGSMHKQVWKGAESDNDSYISTDRDGMGSDDDDDDDEFEEFESIAEMDEEAKAAAKAARKAERKAAKKEKMRGIKEEIQALNSKLEIDGSHRTPQLEEELAVFYSRTAVYWETQANEKLGAEGKSPENEDISVKEMKREGFNLAKSRYDEVKPILDQLSELQSIQNKNSEKKKMKKSSKKEKKSSSKKKSK